MERFWNITYYFVYRGEYRLTLLFNKINPGALIFRLPLLKRLYAKRGITVEEVRNQLDEFHKRPDWGMSSIIAGAFMNFLVFLFCWGIVCIYEGIVRKQGLDHYHFGIMLVVAMVVNQILLFRKDKYLSYFKEFDTMPEKERKKWAWISLAVVVGILACFASCFAFMIYRL